MRDSGFGGGGGGGGEGGVKGGGRGRGRWFVLGFADLFLYVLNVYLALQLCVYAWILC